MNDMDQFQEKVNFRLFKEVRSDINKILLAYPNRFTSESEFYRIAVMQLIRKVKEEKNLNNTIREGERVVFSPRNTSHVKNALSLDLSSFNSERPYGLRSTGEKKTWLTQPIT